MFFSVFCFSDRGSIPYVKGVKIFEPGQKAIISWNGEEEILILSTDLYAEKKTRVLEIIPFKSRPQIKGVDKEVFSDLLFLINREIFLNNMTRNISARNKGSNESIKVVFKKQIGQHDITTLYIKNKENFISSLKDYMRSDQGADIEAMLSTAMYDILKKYLEKGYRYFVVDKIEIDPEVISSDCILYRFKSKELYYPLLISSLESGVTAIELMVITRGLLHYFPEMKSDDIKLLHEPLELNINKLKNISNDIYSQFAKDEIVKIRLWRIEDDLSRLRKDIIAK